MKVLEILFATLSVASLTHATEVIYMDEWCGETYYAEASPAIRVKLTEESSYQANWECTMTISGEYMYEDRFMIDFQDLSIGSSSGWYQCDDDWLKIYDGDDDYSPTIGPGKFCGQNTPSTLYTTTGEDITLHFKSGYGIQYSGFDIILTHFKDGYCDSWEISCDNGRCIDDSLRCNGYNPCGDYSDCQLTVGEISGIAVGAVVCFIITLAIIVVCVRRRRRYVATGPVMPVVTATVGHVPYQGYNQPVPGKYGAIPQGPPPYTPGNQQTSGLLTSYPPPPAYSN